jgi:hypothetical protein
MSSPQPAQHSRIGDAAHCRPPCVLRPEPALVGAGLFCRHRPPYPQNWLSLEQARVCRRRPPCALCLKLALADGYVQLIEVNLNLTSIG